MRKFLFAILILGVVGLCLFPPMRQIAHKGDQWLGAGFRPLWDMGTEHSRMARVDIPLLLTLLAVIVFLMIVVAVWPTVGRLFPQKPPTMGDANSK